MAVYPLLLATLPEGRRRARRLGTSTFFSLQHQGAGGDGEDGARQHAGTAAQADSVRSHRQERRPFGLTPLEVGGWRCLRGVGGAWRQDAERWLNRGGAGRSRGVLAEPVALLHPEVAQRRRSQRQGGQKVPSTRRCIKTPSAAATWSCARDCQKALSTRRPIDGTYKSILISFNELSGQAARRRKRP